jgi:hypothetical protein
MLTCQSNRMVDNSINNTTLTTVGSISIQRYSPFNPSSVTPTSYSGYFDGSGDYLTCSSSATNFSTSSFTIEFWVNFQSLPSSGNNYNIISATVTNGVEILYRGTGNYIEIGRYAVGPSLQYAWTPSLGAWDHVAFVRNSTTVTIYINGTSVTSGTVSQDFQTGLTNIGSAGGTQSFFAGYLSNVRVVKDTAVYTSNFTPSTTPLTAIANTSLLTCQSTTFIDNSTNNFTITAVGNSQPTQQNPFGFTSATTNGYTVSTIGGSGYFDGTGDSLQAPSGACISGTGDFTAECWIYPTTVPGTYNVIACSDTSGGLTMFGLNANGTIFMGRSLIDVQATTSNSASYNSWNHIVISRSGGTLRLFVNGIQGYSGSIATNYTAGIVRVGTDGGGSSLPYTGYISNLRIIPNSAIYTSNFVPPSAPIVAIQNSSLLLNMTSAGVYDAAMMNNMETVADAKLSTAVSKFGGSSMSFDGTGDYMIGSAFSNPVHSIGSGDFTIEMWLYTNANKAQILIDTGTVGGSTTGIQCALNASGYPNTVLNNSIVLTSSILVSTTTWTHVAWVRSSGTLVIYVNGVSGGSVANSINISDTGLTIGTPNDYRDGSSTYHYNGYIDDLRITKGVARYTSNFTPPTTAFPIY